MSLGGDSKIINLHPEFLAAAQDAETYEAAVACAKGQGWPAQTVVNASIQSIIQSVSRSKPPGILVVDIDGSDDPVTQVGQLVKVCAGRSQIIIIGSANDISFYRNIVQTGAIDYLVKPISGIALRDSVVPLLAHAKSGSKDKNDKKASGQVHIIIGIRGGVGATTIAVNSAWILAHQTGLKTALVDLDLQFGNCDLALDLESGRGLREVLANPDRMDSLLINSALAKESETLSVFCCEESLEELVDFDTSGAIALTKELRSEYDHIIVDIPRSLIPRHRRLIVSADHIVLVADMTLAAIRDTQRILSSIANLGTSAQIHILAGKIGDGEAQITPAQFERSVKSKIEVSIPHDPKTVKLCANRGKSIFDVGAGGSQLGRAIQSVVELLVPNQLGPTDQKSGLGGLFSGFLKKG